MAELTPESARSILDAWERSRAADVGPEGLYDFVVNSSALGLVEEGFDWMRWAPYQDGRYADPDFIAAADRDTLRRIATTHFRLDRFVGGHLEAMETSGVIAQIVQRLRELAEAGEL